MYTQKSSCTKQAQLDWLHLAQDKARSIPAMRPPPPSCPPLLAAPSPPSHLLRQKEAPDKEGLQGCLPVQGCSPRTPPPLRHAAAGSTHCSRHWSESAPYP
eukprot:1156027-Pelagomonas_calceolata.AAC.5